MILALITSLYALLAIGTAYYLGAPKREILTSSIFSSMICAQLLIFYGVTQIGIAIYQAKTIHLLPLLKAIDARFSNHNQDNDLTNGIKALGILCPLFIGFTIFKSLIPLIHPYSIDPILSQIDFHMHGNTYPHHYLPNNLWAVRIAEWVYYLWFLMVFISNGFVIFFDKNTTRRTHYLWASVLSWGIIGSLGATLFSSVGPVFYGDFYQTNNPYSDIQDTLSLATSHGEVLWPEAVQVLLDMTRNSVIADLNGISAMPSMHIGISFLISLYALTVHRGIGIGCMIFSALIFLSSLILGFHYAIDGYMACIAVGVIWILVSKFSSKMNHTNQDQYA